MAEYPLNRTVFKKDAYENTIDTSFSQVSVPPPPLEDTITVTEFFNLYNTLFYDIPAQGDTNSHAYIVAKSGDYINADQISEDVQVLLDEITILRQDLLAANQQLIILQISASVPTSINVPTF
jgi:hypothetical protein